MPLSPAEFEAKYPLILEWMNQTLAAHAASARPVADVGFRRLPRYFSSKTLTAAKVAVVDALPVPPVAQWGLSQFSAWANGDYAGITYQDTFFVRMECQADESLHFHELIHILQWQMLGPKRFIAAYAAGLEQFGYRASPLERMAYDAQARFDRAESFDAETLVTSALR